MSSSFDDTYDGDEVFHDDRAPPFHDEHFPSGDDVAPAETYGFNPSPNADHSPSPFDPLVPESDVEGRSYDMAADGDGIFTDPDGGPLLPDPTQMREEGAAFREWRRLNAIHLEEKEKMEKEMRTQILNEAEEFKKAFYEKRNLNCESTKKLNREREKLYWTNQEKFHKEADKQYWKAIAEVIPREVANIEKRGRKKDEEKKPGGITIVQGPKPGKPTDMTRMRQLVAKLKQKPPPHMLPKEVKDAKNGTDGNDKGDKKDDEEAKKKDSKKKDGKNGKDEPETKPVSPAKDSPQNGAPNGAEPEAPVATEGEKVVEKETEKIVA